MSSNTRGKYRQEKQTAATKLPQRLPRRTHLRSPLPSAGAMRIAVRDAECRLARSPHDGIPPAAGPHGHQESMIKLVQLGADFQHHDV